MDNQTIIMRDKNQNNINKMNTSIIIKDKKQNKIYNQTIRIIQNKNIIMRLINSMKNNIKIYKNI